MAKTWSEKLQCPVDEDADYGNTYVRTIAGTCPKLPLTLTTTSGATGI